MNEPNRVTMSDKNLHKQLNSFYQANKEYFFLPLMFLIARLFMLISIPLEGLKSYGDMWNFYHIASLGMPFWDLWVEFPPLFPFINRAVYLLAGGKEHVFVYLLLSIFSFIQAANIYLFQIIGGEVLGSEQQKSRSTFYAFALLTLFYGWTYFDSLGVLCMLLGLYFIFLQKDVYAGISIGLGGLVKLFPVLLLPGIWKWRGAKAAFKTVITVMILLVAVWGFLYLNSPELTKASFLSQYNKGSWESIWAVIDGNIRTGNFSPEVDRTVAMTANIKSGSPAVISPWITLAIFGGIGFVILYLSRLSNERDFISFICMTVIIFYLWSPGYSPQWVLILFPLILLCFEESRAYLIGLIFLMINLLEWPIILSRGWFHILEEVVILRFVIYCFVAALLVANLVSFNRLKEVGNFDTSEQE